MSENPAEELGITHRRVQTHCIDERIEGEYEDIKSTNECFVKNNKKHKIL